MKNMKRKSLLNNRFNKKYTIVSIVNISQLWRYRWSMLAGQMKIAIYILCTGILFMYSCGYQKKSGNSEHSSQNIIQSTSIPIIFDTDIQGDYDDVGAMGMLHAFADQGEVEILATVASNLSPLTAPVIEIINTYYGRPDIPIGSPKTTGAREDAGDLHWPDSLMVNYPHKLDSNDDAPDAVSVYRKVLSQQPDNSVTIVTVGFLTNLKNLMLSEPDSISPLSGKQLISKKVKRWVAMAGHFPNGKETNVKKDPSASQLVIDNWPTEIVFSGFEIGLAMKTGLRLIKDGPEHSPVRMAYALSIPNREYDKEGRRSWDQSALLAAVKGYAPYFTYKTGTFITSADGSNSWKDDPDGSHKHIVFKMEPDSVAYAIENLMMHDAQ